VGLSVGIACAVGAFGAVAVPFIFGASWWAAGAAGIGIVSFGAISAGAFVGCY
jgi:hypothetical protein